MRALIVFGADVNITNKRHETPRHLATFVRQHCWRDVVRAVGFVGAVACDRSKNGCTLECSEAFQGEMMIGKKKNVHLNFLEACGESAEYQRSGGGSALSTHASRTPQNPLFLFPF